MWQLFTSMNRSALNYSTWSDTTAFLSKTAPSTTSRVPTKQAYFVATAPICDAIVLPFVVILRPRILRGGLFGNHDRYSIGGKRANFSECNLATPHFDAFLAARNAQ